MSKMKDMVYRDDAIEAWDKLSKRGRTEFDQVLMTLPSIERGDVEMNEVKSPYMQQRPNGADLISRADAIERVELITKCEWDNNVIYRDEVIDALKFAPSADRPTLNQTDTLIIADALRYLAKDTERHLADRTRADALRKQILQYGASMCHPAEAEQTVIRSRTFMPTKDFKEMDEQTVIDHDRDWIIGCIEHDGFIHTHRFDKANQIIHDALSADTVSREEYEEVKAYMDTLVDAFIEDGEELAESVKVVRCKDCRWFKQDSSPVGYGYCDGRMVGREVDYNDYCSYGERQCNYFGEREEKVNDFKRVGQAWNTSQERREP